ncbi:sigma-54 dependent transcriptional regulator [Polymorphobacter sp. PAMC 29334]|nr:sigma-54 dependent transcriptional regulator [Polymorphobacter sp. PAMC 29334]
MKAPASPPTKLAELVGASPAIVKVRALVDQLAASSVSILVTGPSGSGKEVVAQLLHQRSSRAARPFVAINCAAIPRDLLESEIFGHEAGSFTGAAKARRGRFELADTGTLFLDEIGDMPAEFQVKLLRILETRLVERVGGMLAFPVDVRLIAATNVDLAEAVASGRFREDLFYRLAVVEIRLPGLAERESDVPLLLEHFARHSERPRVGFTASATDYLAAQPWRGTSASCGTSSRGRLHSTPARCSTGRSRRHSSMARGTRSTGRPRCRRATIVARGATASRSTSRRCSTRSSRRISAMRSAGLRAASRGRHAYSACAGRR